jgi:hypothetical protein
MGNGHYADKPPRSRGANAPELCMNFPPLHKEGAGNAGRSTRRSLACKIKKHTSIVTTVTPDTPGIPYAMVLTVSFGLSSVIGLVVTVASGNFPPT